MSRPGFRRFGLKTIAFAVAAMLVGPGLTAAAATMQTAEPGTLTVTGFGSASVPAEAVTIQILVSPADYFGGPPTELAGTPSADGGDTASPVVEALRGVDVPDDAVQVVTSPALASSFGPGTPGTARLDITLDGADLARVNEVIDAAGTGANEAGLVIIGVGVDYSVADCSALTHQAREAAIADAQAQADVQAELLGLTRGEIVSSEDALSEAGLLYGGSQALDGCPGEIGGFAVSQGLTLSQFDPTAPAEVEVFAAVNLTFAIEGA